ncbi:3,4-dihydroxy-2-butanone-4-phosphate synthase [Rhodobacteraceae bacterium KMM 6894]|nr:3,4-dihydroxy-2-butanone-4-phosphate synthase [Rhodobacteraceae bacterium KMM 6894]
MTLQTAPIKDPVTGLSSIEDIIEDARQGRMCILVDDEDRENEGDLFIPARAADAGAINYMALHGRGLICLAMSRERTERLELPLMARGNESRLGTAFTVSIEAREGVTTGISAADRARTVQAAVAENAKAGDIVSPGHIFPLVARDGGVLTRSGHTEAAVDISRMAGMGEAGVICEIMNPDGTMARLPELLKFAEKEGLKVATIADLITYRRKKEELVIRVAEETIDSRHGGTFTAIVFRNIIDDVEHVALVKGDITDGTPVPVRVHAVNLFDDIIGDKSYSHGSAVFNAMEYIQKIGRGVVVLMRETQRNSPSAVLSTRGKHSDPSGSNIRDYGTGAQILHNLGVREMILLNNSDQPLVALQGYGLSITRTAKLEQ